VVCDGTPAVTEVGVLLLKATVADVTKAAVEREAATVLLEDKEVVVLRSQNVSP